MKKKRGAQRGAGPARVGVDRVQQPQHAHVRVRHHDLERLCARVVPLARGLKNAEDELRARLVQFEYI